MLWVILIIFGLFFCGRLVLKIALGILFGYILIWIFSLIVFAVAVSWLFRQLFG